MQNPSLPQELDNDPWSIQAPPKETGAKTPRPKFKFKHMEDDIKNPYGTVNGYKAMRISRPDKDIDTYLAMVGRYLTLEDAKYKCTTLGKDWRVLDSTETYFLTFLNQVGYFTQSEIYFADNTSASWIVKPKGSYIAISDLTTKQIEVSTLPEHIAKLTDLAKTSDEQRGSIENSLQILQKLGVASVCIAGTNGADYIKNDRS